MEALSRAASMSEIQEAEAELLRWQSDIGDRDKSLRGYVERRDIYVSSSVSSTPVRGVTHVKTVTAESTSRESKTLNDSEKPSRISGYDFKAWEKFDADAAVASVDQSEREELERTNRAVDEIRSHSLSAAERRDRQHKLLMEKLRSDAAWDQMSETARSLKAERERLKGNEYFKSKEFETAFDCYSRSIAFNETATAYSNRAMAAIKLERFDGAVDDCTRSLALDPRFLKALVRRGTALTYTGQYGKAIEDFKAALDLEPSSTEIAKLLEKAKAKYRDVEGKDYNDLRETVPPPPPVPLNERFISIDKIDSLEGILSSLNSSEFLCRGTANVKAQETFTRIVISEEDSEDEEVNAIESTRVPSVDPFQGLLDAVANLESNGLHTEAFVMLQDAIKNSQSFDQLQVLKLHEKLVDCLIYLDDFDEALKVCTEILTSQPSTIWALAKRAECLKAKVFVFKMRHMSHHRQSDFKAMRQDIEMALAIEPESPSVHDLLQWLKYESDRLKDEGNKAASIGDNREALRLYSASLDAHPENFKAMNNRAQMYLGLGQNEMALRDAIQVIQEDPYNVKACYRAAQANEQLGNLEQAKSFCSKVLEIDKANSSAALLLQKINDRLKSSVENTTVNSVDDPSQVGESSHNKTKVPTKISKKLEGIKLRTPEVPTTPPNTVYELERTWRGLRGRADLFAVYLSCFKKSTFKKVRSAPRFYNTVI